MVLVLFVLILLGLAVLSWWCDQDTRDGRDWTRRG
jgi:hypothetical protein